MSTLKEKLLTMLYPHHCFLCASDLIWPPSPKGYLLHLEATWIIQDTLLI